MVKLEALFQSIRLRESGQRALPAKWRPIEPRASNLLTEAQENMLLVQCMYLQISDGVHRDQFINISPFGKAKTNRTLNKMKPLGYFKPNGKVIEFTERGRTFSQLVKDHMPSVDEIKSAFASSFGAHAMKKIENERDSVDRQIMEVLMDGEEHTREHVFDNLQQGVAKTKFNSRIVSLKEKGYLLYPKKQCLKANGNLFPFGRP